jgi:hypothetical protein
MNELRNYPQFVAWAYVQKTDKAKPDKVPLDPHTGKKAAVNAPATWGTYQEAEGFAVCEGLPGVGFVLTEDCPIAGYDLDDCRDPKTGEFDPWAREILDRAETYAELSPSGTGVRIFTLTRPEKAVCHKPSGVEVYRTGRYLTVTGHHIAGTPDEIRSSPGTLATLLARVEADKAARHMQEIRAFGSSTKAISSTPKLTGNDFFRGVNDQALDHLDTWVPALFPQAKRTTEGGYRVSSSSLERSLQEDISIHRDGVVDFGVHDMGDPQCGRRTAIDLLIEHGSAADAVQAAHWLCERMGVDPAALGWCEIRAANGTKPQQTHFPGTGGRLWSSDPQGLQGGKGLRGAPVPRLLVLDKQLVPTVRDRLAFDLEETAPREFPLNALPCAMRSAVEALEEHVQAPRSLCAHSTISASALAAQGHRNIRVPAFDEDKPLSLFLLAVAASGERKSSCDNIASRAIKAREQHLQVEHEEATRLYEAQKAAYEAWCNDIKKDKKSSYEERSAALAATPAPVRPLEALLRLQEPTLEGLQKHLNFGQPSIGVYSAEGGTFLGGHAMSDEATTRSLAGLTTLWDDGSTQRVRANETFITRGRRVSISLAVQPVIAGKLLKNRLAVEQGFVPRFLITMPETRIGQRVVRKNLSRDDHRLTDFDCAIRRLLNASLPIRQGTHNELDPPALLLSEGAWELWQEAAQNLENNCGEDGYWAPIRGSALRMGENIARLAGIFALIDDPSAEEVSAEIMLGAIRVGEFYLAEAMRIVGHGQGLDPEAEAVKALARWLTEKWAEPLISPTLIQQHAPNSLRGNIETIHSRVAALQKIGVLEWAGPGEIRGKPYRETYQINRGAEQ